MQDLRTWLDQVNRQGELKEISGAHWKFEIGALSGLVTARAAHPAVLFDNIPDHKPGFRVLGCALTTPGRVALTFGFPLKADRAGLTAAFRENLPLWERQLDRFGTEAVKDVPCLENIQNGDEVDVLQFPTPLWCEEDGGRYIGTGDAVVTADPDSGEINVGTYRIMVHDRRTLGFFIAPGKHGRIHRDKYHSRGKPCPVAISFGHHPLVFAAGALEVPAGGEYGFMGAIRQDPYPVFREELTGLPVPADAEIVIAGYCPPDKRLPEGPFGEWTGYYASKRVPEPVIEVERIYYRNAPIILGVPNHNPAQASNFRYYRGVVKSAMLHNELEKAGLPGIKSVSISDAFGEQLVVISVRQLYAGHAKQAALLACQSRSAVHMGRYTVVVDEDIDPFDNNDVLWAICTRSDPSQDIDFLRRCWSSPLDPIIRKPAEAFFSSRGIIDACKPFEWKEEFPREITTDREYVRKLREKWRM